MDDALDDKLFGFGGFAHLRKIGKAFGDGASGAAGLHVFVSTELGGVHSGHIGGSGRYISDFGGCFLLCKSP